MELYFLRGPVKQQGYVMLLIMGALVGLGFMTALILKNYQSSISASTSTAQRNVADIASAKSIIDAFIIRNLRIPCAAEASGKAEKCGILDGFLPTTSLKGIASDETLKSLEEVTYKVNPKFTVQPSKTAFNPTTGSTVNLSLNDLCATFISSSPDDVVYMLNEKVVDSKTSTRTVGQLQAQFNCTSSLVAAGAMDIGSGWLQTDKAYMDAAIDTAAFETCTGRAVALSSISPFRTPSDTCLIYGATEAVLPILTVYFAFVTYGFLAEGTAMQAFYADTIITAPYLIPTLEFGVLATTIAAAAMAVPTSLLVMLTGSYTGMFEMMKKTLKKIENMPETPAVDQVVNEIDLTGPLFVLPGNK